MSWTARVLLLIFGTSSPQRWEARGRELDRLAEVLGTHRRRWFWIFRELDKTLRARLERIVRATDEEINRRAGRRS